jgi:putative ABC transport system permease protein
MLLKTVVRIIIHEKEKFAGAVAGVTIAVFLMVLQWGFYLGFKRDITIVLDSVDADIWVVPKNQPLFDGYGRIDDLPYGILQAHPDVVSVGRLVWGWAGCRMPHTGGIDTVEVLGMECDSGIDLRLALADRDLASLLRPDGHVLIGDKDRDKLGIFEPGTEGIEINGRRAIAVGFVPDVHLFTTAGFVLTDIDNARAFLRMPSSRTNYMVCKCRPGADIDQVVADLQRTIPEDSVFTTQQFHDRASAYWVNRTSIGPLLMMSAVLAVTVGFLIVMLAFYVSTIEKIPTFACMKALGASDSEVVLLLVCQAVLVFAAGCSIAGLALYMTMMVLAHTTISFVITPNVILIGLGVTLVVSVGSSLLSVRRVLTTEPGEAFRT